MPTGLSPAASWAVLGLAIVTTGAALAALWAALDAAEALVWRWRQRHARRAMRQVMRDRAWRHRDAR
jgi:hypothetical protein